MFSCIVNSLGAQVKPHFCCKEEQKGLQWQGFLLGPFAGVTKVCVPGQEFCFWTLLVIDSCQVLIHGTWSFYLFIALLIPRALIVIYCSVNWEKNQTKGFLGSNYPFIWLCWIHSTFHEALSHSSIYLRHCELSSCL